MSSLSKYKVSDLDLPSPLICLNHPQSSLFEAIDVLSEKHLLSVPILDSSNSTLIGMLDCLDIVAYTVRNAAEGKKKLVDAPLDKVMGLARDGAKPAEVGLDTPLDKVAGVISGPARRAVVVDADGKAHSVITQSGLLQFLYSKRAEIEADKLNLTADDICTTSPLCVTMGQSAMSAFQAIHSGGVSSVAIVEEETGKVVSVASATDLVVGLSRMTDKAWGSSSAVAGAVARLCAECVAPISSWAKDLQSLEDMSILDLISSNRQLDHKAKAATVSVRPDESLERILEKLAKTRVHRVMVCAQGRKPHGVLSLTDVCKVVAESKP